MALSIEENPRYQELAKLAPVDKRKLWMQDGDRFLLCATLGAEFDRWQRALSVVSAADGYYAQMLGLNLVEALMDELEAELPLPHKPRRSPGYGDLPLSLSVEILDKLKAREKMGLSLTDDFLLVPSKSVTAICEIVV